MTNYIIIFIVLSTIITTIINFIKPAYKKFAGKFNVTINVALSFILGIIASFSVAPYLEIELNNWLLVLIGLTLWTWSTIWYDLREIVRWLWDKLKVTEVKSE